jgi:hypothetical protein
MASIITATTTSGLTQSADNSGVLQLASGTGNLVTVPSVTGTAMVSGNMPAFSAYLGGSNQSISSGTQTVAILDAEDYDTAGCFNNTGSTVTLNGLSVPAYSFCPNVAGYYQISTTIRFYSSTNANITSAVANINRNGSILYRFFEITTGTWSSGWSASGSSLVYLNGTGDYLQLAAQFVTTSPQFENSGTPYTSRMQGVLVRRA